MFENIGTYKDGKGLAVNFEKLRQCAIALDNKAKEAAMQLEVKERARDEPDENANRPNPLFVYLKIEEVIYDNPSTIVKWSDGTKTVVTCMDNMVKRKNGSMKPGIASSYSKEHGLAMCIVKKMCGNTGRYNNIFRKFGAID